MMMEIQRNKLKNLEEEEEEENPRKSEGFLNKNMGIEA
jgi:hypothetical protein